MMNQKAEVKNPVVTIESVDQEGRGIAHHEGKVIFIEGALIGERVTYSSFRKKPSFENAQSTAILKKSFMRVEPQCPHFGVCGGCSMQHLDARGQVAVKQRILEESLKRIGKVTPQTILPPKISKLIPLLARMLETLSIREQLPQIEVACGDHVDALVLRIMAPLTENDAAVLRAFADEYGVQFWTQTKGPETVLPFYPLDVPALSYSLPEFGIEMPFAPTEFTQVNHALNRLMVHRALRLLAPQAGERIVDFFCGLGNFTLQIARSGAQVLGIEGSAALDKRAQQSAAHNGLSDNTTFVAMNLFEMNEEELQKLGSFDKWLIDPPRDGAMELIKAITPATAPQRIVYVSCNPATLARDADALVNTHGYILQAAGVMNMFPQTSHVESIAIFEKG